MQVKKFLCKSAGPLLLAAALLLASGMFAPEPKPIAVVRPVTAQQRAERRIRFEHGGLCTATAIAPHALLTAVHCNEDDITTVTLDMSMRKFHILSKTLDGRDHVIYVLDGQEFKNTVTLLPGEHTALPLEPVYIYGAGGHAYPLEYKEGYKTYAVKDVSEVDRADGFSYYTIPVIPGDSGSAIFGKDGRIVAVTTYKIGIPKDGNWETEDDADIVHYAAAFDVNFTASQLTAIAVGQGDTSMSKKEVAPPKSFLDIFSH